MVGPPKTTVAATAAANAADSASGVVVGISASAAHPSSRSSAPLPSAVFGFSSAGWLFASGCATTGAHDACAAPAAEAEADSGLLRKDPLACNGAAIVAGAGPPPGVVVLDDDAVEALRVDGGA